MNIRDKASRLRVNAQVAAERAVTPGLALVERSTEFVKNQRDAHRQAVDAKCADLAEKRAERAEEITAPVERLENLKFISSQEFLDQAKKIIK